MATEPGTKLGRYEIRSKLGAGGMGEVYLAQDTSELGRTVALKIISAEVAKDKDRLQRFTQEARTVSNLNHPNILTVYEFGQTESVSFIATEFVDGVTLRQHLSNRRLKLIDVLDVAIQIVGALNAAHEAGVTHRDLKPENVMVRKDHIVKVLDFGLAKLSGPGAIAIGSTGNEDATRLQVNTTPGLIMGTVSYMSPEQSGGKGVDHRTDIWSTGVVLYEMIAGSVPFQGKDIHRQIIAIQESEPAPLSQQVEGLPERLEEIVTKCLAKEKDERYQTAKDLLIDLRSLRRKLDVDAEIERTVAPEFRRSTASGSPAATQAAQIAETTNAPSVPAASSAEYVVSGIKQHKLLTVIAALVLVAGAAAILFYLRGRTASAAIKSIAVMPFVNEGGNADMEYLADGFTETLISRLSQLPNLNVKARSFVYRYKGKEINPQQVGKELGVQAILNGRVVPHGSDLIVYLELVDATTGNLIWGDQYNRKQSDLVSLQTDLARDVSTKLKAKLSGTDEQKLTKKDTENSEAYNLYLQGRFYAGKRTPKDTEKGLEYLHQAVNADPNFALAYAGLAVGYTYEAIYGNVPPRQVLPQAREFAKKSIELDDTLAEAHQILGLLLFLQDHDTAGWERESKRAIELSPNSAEAHRLEGLRLVALAKFDEANVELKKALEIEPLSASGNMTYGAGLYFSGRNAEAEAQLKKTIELSPDFWLAHSYLSYVYHVQGNQAGASEERARTEELRGDVEAAKIVRDGFASGGWPGVTRAILSDPRTTRVMSYDLACFYAENGDKDKALATINQLIENQEYMLFMKVEPAFQSLHSDPRFNETLRKLGLPE